MKISDEKYWELKVSLEKQNARTYTLREVKEIGNHLIEFYVLLMDQNMRKDFMLQDIDKASM